MVGKLPYTGSGTPVVVDASGSIDALRKSCAARNNKLRVNLREQIEAFGHNGSTVASELDRLTREDAQSHRVTQPVEWEQFDHESCLLHPRFGLVQLRADGTSKLRPIDHMSWSDNGGGKAASVNGHTWAAEKNSPSTIDQLAQVMRAIKERTGEVPHLLKADIDSAFRRIPVAPRDRWCGGFAYVCSGKIYCARHSACCFGAVSSVHAWERIGNALCFLAKRVLHIPMHRYVDDYFAAERPGTVEVAMQSFAKLVEILLGPGAVAPTKVEHGSTLCILGVDVRPRARGFSVAPSRDKIKEWLATINGFLRPGGKMMPGDAEKMAGRLAWGSSYAFRQYGRAMLRPIYDQQTKRCGKIDFELRSALEWWRIMLSKEIVEFHEWAAPMGRPVHLFADARGNPAHVGAVLIIDGACYWTHSSVPSHLMCRFRRREDQQIMGLELLGMALGVSTFANMIQQRKLVIHCDNTGAEASTWHNPVLPARVARCSCRSQYGKVRRGRSTMHSCAMISGSIWRISKRMPGLCVSPLTTTWRISPRARRVAAS